MAWNAITTIIGNHVKTKDLAKQPTYKLIEEISRNISKQMPMIAPTEEEQEKYVAKDNSLQLLRGWFELGIFLFVVFVGAILIFGIDR